MSNEKIVVESPSHGTYKYFHFRKALNHSGKGVVFRFPLRENRRFQEQGEDVQELLYALFNVAGIESVELGSYNVAVWRATAFEWDEIQPHIILAICNVLHGGAMIKVEEKATS